MEVKPLAAEAERLEAVHHVREADRILKEEDKKRKATCPNPQ